MKSDTLSEAVRWNTIASGVSSVLALAGIITLIVVIATVVKRNRPDAYGTLLGWSIGQLVVLGLGNVGYPLLALVAHGSDGYLAATAMFRIVISVAHLGLVLLLVRGLVAIAQPPKPVRVESETPYR